MFKISWMFHNLKWSDHISNIMGKVNKTLGFLCRNLSISSTYTQESAYKSLVRSLPYNLSGTPTSRKTHHGIGPNTCRTLCQQQANNRSSVDRMIQHLEWQSLEQRT